MDATVVKLVKDYALAHLDKSDEKPEFVFEGEEVQETQSSLIMPKEKKIITN